MKVSASETARLYVEKPHVRVKIGTAATYKIWIEAYNNRLKGYTVTVPESAWGILDAYLEEPS
jgi:hypothetical protein